MALTAATSPSSFAPVLHRSIRGQQRAGAFVAAHDDLQQILGGGVGQLAHAEVIDDQQAEQWPPDSMYSLRVPSSDGIGQFVEQDVHLRDTALDSPAEWPLADGLRQVALAGAADPET